MQPFEPFDIRTLSKRKQRRIKIVGYYDLLNVAGARSLEGLPIRVLNPVKFKR